jgi:hypothetical protein
LDIINDIATIIGLARDVVLFVLLAVALIALIIIARKVIGLLNTVKQTAEKAQELMETVSEKVVTPAASNPKAFRALGSVLGFLTGLLRRSKD